MSILEKLNNEDETFQLVAALELSEMLLMSQEDILYTLPVTEIIKALTVILKKDHNPELMMSATRCFIGILEVSPSVSVRMADAVPLLLAKLGQLEYIDLAELCLSVLDRLSRAYGHQIVTLGGLESLQTYFDFFSTASQNAILRIMANCAYFVRPEQLKAYISHEMIGAFAQRLCLMKESQNKTALETLCTFFTRLVDNCATDVDVLRSHFGMDNEFMRCVLLTMHNWPIDSGGVSLLRVVHTVAATCRDLAVALVKIDAAETLHLMLCGSEMNDMEAQSSTSNINAVAMTSTVAGNTSLAQKKADLVTHHRSSSQICQILYLFCDFLPKLQPDGVFEVYDVLEKYKKALKTPTSGTGSAGTTTNVASASGAGRYQWYMKKDDYDHESQYDNEDDDGDGDDDEVSTSISDESQNNSSATNAGDKTASCNNVAQNMTNSNAGSVDANANTSAIVINDEEEKKADKATTNSTNKPTSTTATETSNGDSANAATYDAPAGYETWRALSPQDSVLLELAFATYELQNSAEDYMPLFGGQEFDLEFDEMACYHVRSNTRYLLERRSCGTPNESTDKTKEFVDERELFRSGGDVGYTKLLSLFQLLVNIGNSSTCTDVRFAILRSLSRAIYACSDTTDRLKALLKDVSLSSFIASTLHSFGKHLEIVTVCVQIIRQVLDELADVYVPLFESEGVLYEIHKHIQPANTAKASNSTTTSVNEDKKPSTSQASMSKESIDSTTNSEASKREQWRSKRNKKKENLTDEKNETSKATTSFAGGSSSKAKNTTPKNEEPGASSTTAGTSPKNTASKATKTKARSSDTNVNAISVDIPAKHHVAHQLAKMTNALATSASNAQAVKEKQQDLKAMREEYLRAFIRAQCQKIIANVEKYSRVNDDQTATLAFNRLSSIAKRLTTIGKDVGVEPLEELKTLLAKDSANIITAFQFNQSEIFVALRRYLTEESIPESANSKEKKAGNKKAKQSFTATFIPVRAERLRRFINIFVGDYFRAIQIDSNSTSNEFFGEHQVDNHNFPAFAVAFRNLISRVIVTISQLERFSLCITTSSFVDQDGSMSAKINIAEKMLRLMQRKQLYCYLKRHNNCTSVDHFSRDHISVSPLAAVTSLEDFVLENLHLAMAKRASSLTTASNASLTSSVSAASSASLASANNVNAVAETSASSSDSARAESVVSGGTASSTASVSIIAGASTSTIDDKSRKSSTSSAASEESIGSSRHADAFYGKIELYFGNYRVPTNYSVLQAIMQFSSDLDDSCQDVIPETIWNRDHVFHYCVIGPTSTESTSQRASISELSSSSSSSANSNNSSAYTKPVTRSITSAIKDTIKRDDNKNKEKKKDDVDKNHLSPPNRKMAKVDISRPFSGELIDSDSRMDVDVQAFASHAHGNLLDKYMEPISAIFNAKILADDPSMDCLALLKALYGVNTLAWSVQDNHDKLTFAKRSSIIPTSEFFAAKLDSKVTRQLSDVLCVVMGRLPRWLKLAVTELPFAFQFLTRLRFMQYTAFGGARALHFLLRESDIDRNQYSKLLIHRLAPDISQRKIVVNRDTLLDDARRMFADMDSNGVHLDVQFDGEVGSGHGPTLEFYSALSRELQRHSLGMWGGKGVAANAQAANDMNDNEKFTIGENGLYPREHLPPIPNDDDGKKKITEKEKELLINFNFLGRLLAQALVHGRLLDIEFAPSFFKWLLVDDEHGEPNFGFGGDFASVEPTVHNSLVKLFTMNDADFDAMQMCFTYPGSEFALTKNGSDTMVDAINFKEFITLVTTNRLCDSVRAQMLALRDGFRAVATPECTRCLHIFEVNEMKQLFSGAPDDDLQSASAIWSPKALWRSLRVDHGYTMDSPQVEWLVQMLNHFSKEQRRKFLHFVSGSPRLPIGGFAALSPPMTVVRKVVNGPFELPSAMTCFNYLKLPAYETYEQLVERFMVALEFTHSFYLS